MKVVAIAYNLKPIVNDIISKTSRSELMRMSVEAEIKGIIPHFTTEAELLSYARDEAALYHESVEDQLDGIFHFAIQGQVVDELSAFEMQVDTNKIIEDYLSYFKANGIPYFIAEFGIFDPTDPTTFARAYVGRRFEDTKGTKPTAITTWTVPDFEEDPPEPVLDIPVSVRTVKKEIYEKIHS